MSSHSVLAATQDMEMQLVCGRPLAPVRGCVPIEQHHDLARKLARAFALEAQVARTVRALPPGQPQSEDVARLTMEISGLVSEVLAAIPQSRERTGLAARLGKMAR